MTSDSVAELFATGPLVVGAKEPGAGSLMAALIARLQSPPPIVALLEPQAWPYFEAIAVEKILVKPNDDGSWTPDPAAIVAKLKPARIITGASGGWTIEKSLIDIGRAQRVPVATFVDQYWNLWQRFAGATPQQRWRYRPDTILLPDQRATQRMIELGCPVRDLRSFAHPLMAPASSVARSAERRRAARTRLGIGESELVILFVSEYTFEDPDGWEWDQPTENDIEMLGKALYEICGKFKRDGQKVLLLLRPHPSESRDWRGILGTDDAVTIAAGLDKEDLISAADMAVGLNSTLLAEAAAQGVVSYSWFPSGSYGGLKLADFRTDISDLRSRDQLEASIRHHLR